MNLITSYRGNPLGDPAKQPTTDRIDEETNVIYVLYLPQHIMEGLQGQCLPDPNLIWLWDTIL